MFSTTDGYSLDVFVVDGWPLQVLLALEGVVNYNIRNFMFPL